MAKKSTVKVRLVPEEKTDSKFFYYAKIPSSGLKAKDKLRGNIFPQFKNRRNNLDIKFSKKPILVLSNKYKKSFSKKINFYRNKSKAKLSRYLKNVNCEGLIVRPDRFILASIKKLKDVKFITKKNLKLLI